MGKTIEELVGELNGNTQQTTSKNKNNSMVDLANQLNGNMSKTDTETPVQRQQHIDQLMDQTFVKEPNALQQGWDFINKNIIQPVDNNIVKPVVGTSEKIGKGALAAVESVPSFFQEQFANLSKANNEMMIQGRIQELEHMDRVERKNKGLAMLPTSYYTSPEWRKHAVDSLERGNQSGLLQNASSNAEQSAQEAIKKQQQIKQNVGVQPGAGELAYNVVGGLEKIAPALATTAITKNPVPFLASTGLTSFSDTYANAKRNGMNDEQASSFATGTALTDTALNSIPLHQFLNPGVSVLKEMAKQGLTQQVIGDVSSLINYGIEKKVLNQNMSLGEAWKRLQETGLTPGVTGAIMGGFSSVSERNAYNSAIKKVENGQPLNKAEHEIYLKHTINPEIQSLSNNNQNFTPNTGAINSISPEAQNGPKTEPNISVADNTPNGQSPESTPGSKIINDVPKAQLEPSSNISMANDVQNQTGFSSVGDNLLNRVKNMTPEEMLDRAYRNPVSGMWNRLAYDEIRANPEAVKPIQMAIDANGMKYINDTYGHDAGDMLLKAYADAAKSIGIDHAFHTGGDEFFIQADSPKQAEQYAKALQGKISNGIIKVFDENGNEIHMKGMTFGYGIGEDPKSADTALLRHKQQQVDSGIRSKERGGRPPGLVTEVKTRGEIWQDNPDGIRTGTGTQKIVNPTLNQEPGFSMPIESTKTAQINEQVSGRPNTSEMGKGYRGNADMGRYSERMAPPAPPEVARKFGEDFQYKQNEPGTENLSYSERPRRMIEMPEIVEIAKQLNDGKTPSIKARLGKALGYFSHQGTEGNIKLRADIFKNPGQAAKTLAHEIGHLVDWLPDKDMAKGNILGRVASLKKYMKHVLPEKPGSLGELTAKDRARLRYQAEQLIKNQKAIEGEDIGISPKDVIAIWNDVGSKEKNPELYDFISKMSAAEKKQVLKDAFRGEVNFKLPDENYHDWDAEIKAKYQDLIREEIVKRKLFDWETMTNELKGVSQEWKPFDEAADPNYTKYRHSSKELYADSISILFNEPELLRQKAPSFYKAFFNYLENKPAVKAVYDDIQSRLMNPEEVGANRLEGAYKMLEEGNEAREEARKRAETNPLTVVDTIEKYLIDKDQPILKKIRGAVKQGGKMAETARNARYEIEETKYMSAAVGQYLKDVSDQVLKPMNESGLAVEDMGVYMLAKRAATERSTIANPRGLDETAATRMIDDLKAKLGPAKFTALEKAVDSYRNLREKVIISQVEDASMYSNEMIDLMKESKNYAKFSVIHYLENKFGSGGTSRVYKQIGTLSDIENPFVATVIQDLSMMRAAKMNTAKTATVDFLKELGDIESADRRFNGQGMEAVDPKDPRKKLFSVLKDGQLESYYVDKGIAETFERQPFEASKVGEIFSNMTNPVKQVLVSKNPFWMARNVLRDFGSTVKNNEEVRFRDVPKLLNYYRKAFQEVAAEVFKGKRSADIKALHEGFMVNQDRNYSGKDESFDNEIQRLVDDFEIDPMQNNEALKKRSLIKRSLSWLNQKAQQAGKVSELTGKVAGYKYLKENSNLTEAEIGHRVRTRIGTPDARRQGALHSITNNLFMFSNIGKEGLRSMAESYRANPGRYIFKTMMMNVLPKLVLFGAASAGADELKKIIGQIPEYDKQMYTVVPLCETKEGKAMYLRIPQDYEGQTWSAIVWALANGKITGPKGAIDTGSQTNPYNLNPFVKVGADLYTYYVKGQNPQDDYRGTPIIPQKAFTAGGWPAHQAMLKNVWSNLGGNVIYTPGDYSDKNSGSIEKALKLPGLNVLGTFLKVSDKGEQEQYYAKLNEEKQQKAQQSIKIENRVIEHVKSLKELPTIKDIILLYREMRQDDTLPKGTSPAEFKNQYLRYAAKAVPDSDLRLILKAPSVEKRSELVAQLRKDMTRRQYAELVRTLRGMGVRFRAAQ